jgi:hypothetical protein
MTGPSGSGKSSAATTDQGKNIRGRKAGFKSAFLSRAAKQGGPLGASRFVLAYLEEGEFTDNLGAVKLHVYAPFLIAPGRADPLVCGLLAVPVPDLGDMGGQFAFVLRCRVFGVLVFGRHDLSPVSIFGGWPIPAVPALKQRLPVTCHGKHGRAALQPEWSGQAIDTPRKYDRQIC